MKQTRSLSEFRCLSEYTRFYPNLFDLVLFQDDLFKRYNETVANFEFGEIQFSLSWEATGMVRDLYLDRYIRRTDFPLDFLIRKNIYRPSMINAGSLNTHFISPRNLT